MIAVSAGHGQDTHAGVSEPKTSLDTLVLELTSPLHQIWLSSLHRLRTAYIQKRRREGILARWVAGPFRILC